MGKLAPVLFFILMGSLAWSLTMEEGNMKLVVDDATGGFQLYQRQDRNSIWEPLMGDSFTSTYFAVYYEDEWINLLIDPVITRWVESDGLSIDIIFEESRFHYRLNLELVQKGSAPLQNYLSCKGYLQNKDNESHELGLRFLLDSRFKMNQEYFQVTGESIQSEKGYSRPLPEYVLNRGISPSDQLFILPGEEGMQPDHLVLANWYRLDKSESLPFLARQGRPFDALPFSLDDGALAYYWNPRDLDPRESMTISMLLGLDEPEQDAPEIENLAELNPETLKYRIQMVEDHLDYLEEFLNELNFIEQSGQNLSENDILVLRRKLEILKSKKSEYEDIQQRP